MIYVVLGILFGFIVWGIVLEFSCDDFSNCIRENNIGISLIIGVVLTILFAEIGLCSDWRDADYNIYLENYALEEVHENQYYVFNTDGNSVSVWIKDGAEWEKKTFSEDKVRFQSTNGEASVQIEVEKLEVPSCEDQFMFLKGVGTNQEKEIYKSAVISVPEGSEITNTPITEKETENTDKEVPGVAQNLYCTECGAELKENSKFCGGCGTEVK